MTTATMPSDVMLQQFLDALSQHIIHTYKNMKARGNKEVVVDRNTIFGSTEADQDLSADKVLGDAVLSFCENYNWIKTATIEGREPIVINENGLIDFFNDPLDGSLNWRQDPDGFLFQHGFCATLVKFTPQPYFSDIVGALGINLSKEIPMIAVESSDQPLTPLNKRDLGFNLGQNITICESYYPEMRYFINWATEMGKLTRGWIRSPGSAVVEMMATALGITSAFVCSMQKMHELGMGYMLVKTHGGICLNLETGEELCGHPFQFNEQVPVVLAANESIAQRWVEIYKAFLRR